MNDRRFEPPSDSDEPERAFRQFDNKVVVVAALATFAVALACGCITFWIARYWLGELTSAGIGIAVALVAKAVLAFALDTDSI